MEKKEIVEKFTLKIKIKPNEKRMIRTEILIFFKNKKFFKVDFENWQTEYGAWNMVHFTKLDWTVLGSIKREIAKIERLFKERKI